MDLLQGKIKGTYFKFLGAAFGSALISSIYAIVDMAMVGQYQGPTGTAALAVVAPVWNIIFSLGLLTGIGGSVLLAQAKGQGNKEEQNRYFTVSFIMSSVLSVISWIIIVFFDTQMLAFFGAEELLLPMAKQYLIPIKYVFPAYLFNQMLAAFLRNDDAPALATVAVLAGGVFNVFGDYFFVFALDMGIEGAGLATAIGAMITLAVMLSHFKSKKNTLKIVYPKQCFKKANKIFQIGFSTFIIDVAMGILTILFNRQIMKYLGADELSVYGVIVNISTIVQCCAYSIGQAGQPLLSTNFGAGKWMRVKETMHCMLFSALALGLIWTLCICIFPNELIGVFMKTTDNILRISPKILRMYGLSFLILPLNVFSTYYFQSVMYPMVSLIIASARGFLISGMLTLLLPAVLGADYIWMTMPITELIVMVFVICAVIYVNKRTESRFKESKSPV